jgi:hypothetical protein
MEKPKVITHEDAWFSYIAGLLEEIRDAVKISEAKVINFSGDSGNQALLQNEIEKVATKVAKRIKSEKWPQMVVSGVNDPPEPPKPPETVTLSESQKPSKPTSQKMVR